MSLDPLADALAQLIIYHVTAVHHTDAAELEHQKNKFHKMLELVPEDKQQGLEMLSSALGLMEEQISAERSAHLKGTDSLQRAVKMREETIKQLRAELQNHVAFEEAVVRARDALVSTMRQPPIPRPDRTPTAVVGA